jgi:hypothetical protein
MTVERLIEAFPELSEDRALHLLELMRGQRSPFEEPATDQWRRSCYHEPNARHPETIMHAIDQIIGGFGCEAIFGANPSQPVAEYSNQGDTYAATILYDYVKGKYRITSWGDWVEQYGDRYQVA